MYSVLKHTGYDVDLEIATDEALVAVIEKTAGKKGIKMHFEWK